MRHANYFLSSILLSTAASLRRSAASDRVMRCGNGFPDMDCARVHEWTVMVWLNDSGFSAGSGQEPIGVFRALNRCLIHSLA